MTRDDAVRTGVKLFGLALVACGTLTLAWYGFGSLGEPSRPPAAVGEGGAADAGRPESLPPLAGGIAIATGLLIMTHTARRD